MPGAEVALGGVLDAGPVLAQDGVELLRGAIGACRVECGEETGDVRVVDET
jgi:hypothetical protein